MRAYLAGAVVTVGCLLVGCSGDNCSGGSCLQGDGGDASLSDAMLDVATDAPKCDLSADLKATPSCIDDGIGVFVDGTSGKDTNTGTKANPFKTITHAIGAAGTKPRVYVCAGTYDEDVSISLANSVSIYGGLKCSDWSYDASLPIIGKTTLAFHVDGATKPLVFSDLTFKAVDGVNPGESSVAAFVNASTDVTLRRVKLRPGVGKAGGPGVTGTNWATVAQNDTAIAGKSASGGTGGGDHACTLCTDSVNSTGGGGGSGGTLTQSGGNDGKPTLTGTGSVDGKGGAAGCKTGDNGPNASAANAAPGATTVGKLTAAGWSANGGSDASNGGPGMGGGGGGGTQGLNPGGGGGGGCGGCGGAGGKGGSGGGGSIGLASVLSKVTLAACDIVTVAGGAGGGGSAGQDGQLGGYAGAAVTPGCAGGVGGQGGKGGAAGGGAGGISVGVLYTDTKPTTDSSTSIVVPSTAAAKGTGGSPGVNDGIDGVSAATMQASST